MPAIQFKKRRISFFSLKNSTENLTAPLIVSGNITNRNAKDYFTVSDMQIHQIEISDLTVNYEYASIPRCITNQLNKVVNANWRILKTEFDSTFEKFFGGEVKSIVAPMFDTIAFQDFFQTC